MGKLTDTGYIKQWLDVVSLTQRTCETGACSQSNEFRGSICKKEHCERKKRETESFAGSCDQADSLVNVMNNIFPYCRANDEFRR